MLRAGPLSDERVMRLANRRFVSVVFDLFPGGALADPEAKRFLVKVRPQFQSSTNISNEPLMIFTPEGEVLGETIRYDSTKAVLSMMQEALRRKPEYARPGPDERAVKDPIEKARIRIDLLDDQGARKLLRGVQSDRAHLLLGQLARRARDFEEMRRQLARVKNPALAADVRMELAYEAWADRDYEELLSRLEGFPEDSPRWTEARYHEGLAQYHLGERKKALAIWRDTIRKAPQGPWIYRADWAYSNVMGGRRKGFAVITGAGSGTSLLGRIDYMMWRNPDLRRAHR